ncbi:LOW QUALITY PROTEIN: uncharacterized protein C9orf43 homolog [Heterocephalus glaber]|uniref:LOW QUALITY PROTEIN: uncharacterized protein C9orf43 homolog n=1 Tax=Heterocephalus glaber TaxID=10181 RepID=A0AAX6TBP3_HETGA|nr:LOW QUALITY PROTEIN: uncharacterized protein C9orf43 homolog [Heterocephalus glaber]
MHLPDDSQWDEAICDLAVCPHPQCWAAVRRIERGHPRILSSPCKTPLDAEDKHPVLTIVNISDSCFQAKKLAHQQSPEFAFTKVHSLLSRGSKCLQISRSQKDLPDKSLITYTKRSPKESHKKLSVLNLNETQLPCSEDVRHMVVIWIPEESEKNMCLPEKTSPFPSQYGKKKRKKLAEFTETGLRTSEVIVPPSSPVVYASEQLSSEIPVRAQDNVLLQDLLKELLPQGEKNMSCVEMKIQLGRMKKSLPLEKNRHDSVISSKMFLTIHCLTLQRPVLRYPEHLKKLHHSLKREGHRKQQQWRQPQGKKEKTPTKQQEAKEKAKSDLKIQNTPNKHSAAVAYNPVCVWRIPRDGSILCRGILEEHGCLEDFEHFSVAVAIVSIERSRKDHFDKSLDFFPNMKSSKMSKKELPCKDLSASVEMVLEAPIANQEKIPGDLSESMAKPSWKPELKPLRILQATDVEEEENQSSRSESEDSLDTD